MAQVVSVAALPSAEGTPGDASPMGMANHWLDRRLAVALDVAQRRTRRRFSAMTLAAALASALGGFSYALAGDFEPMASVLGVAALAVAVSLVTAAALRPVIRQRDKSLLRAASTITHDNLDFLLLLGKVTELRHGETAGHNLRVTAYTLMFTEAIGFAPDQIVRAAKGALLHDIGKLAVPDRVLGKPGPLTPEERQEMQQHVAYGLEIVAQSHFLREAAPVIAAHHEHYDGGGYPHGWRGEAIPLEARVFALVDVFDALTSSRVYKSACSVEEALATMTAGRGSHFDPQLLDRFVPLAPTFIHQLPDDDAELSGLLLDRLSPYLDRIVRLQAALAG